ncbi:ribbon-helix-helix domain-containing protein [Belnapia moabensis]|uniref:ribbon-helix-helix domain-containing protein n=1 Tax=Belnapia moabensis TaxID=365533 RepID=UPI0005B86751|nr:ribbon-helix-helix domain-containing protein [Belnapia moabensis]
MKKADLAAALAEQAGSTRRRSEPPLVSSAGQERAEAAEQPYRQPSRDGTAPITAHFPKEVRRQLKGLANELDRTMHDLIAEAFNDLFAKHGKAEICPRGQ